MAAVDWAKMEAVASELVAGWRGDQPGGAIVGFDQSGIRFAQAAGLADLNHRTPFSAGSVVRLASITKHIFGSMVLMHPDVVRPDQRLGDILSGLPQSFAALTLAQALNMTGGLPDTREALVLHGLSANAPLGEAETVAYSAGLKALNFPSGSELSYSNLGYRFAEWGLRQKGLSFTRFVEDRLRREMGHHLRAPVLWGDVTDDLVPGYWHHAEDGWQPGYQGMPLAAAGNICGSAKGLANWLRALVAGEGALKGVWQGLQISGRLNDGRETGYGLGLTSGLIGGRKAHGHGGSQAGYKAHFLIDDETGAGVVVTSNREDTLAATLARRCFEAAFGLAAPKPLSGTFAPDGLYLDPETGRWAEVKGSVLTHLGSAEQLYAGPDGNAVSISITSPMALRYEGGALIGEIGHAPVRLIPASGEADAAPLQGIWRAEDVGAEFTIKDGIFEQGIGPARQRIQMVALHAGHWLIPRQEKLWPVRILLRQIGPDRVQLSTARARHIIYTRQG